MKKAGFVLGCFVAIALLDCVASPALGQSSSTTTVTENTSAKNMSAKAPFVPRYYHLVFVVKELEAGKVINSRNYAMSVGTVEEPYRNSDLRSIRTGTRIPSGWDQNKVEYLDIGVNIDCTRIVDLEGRLAMNVRAEISSLQSTSAEVRTSTGDHIKVQAPPQAPPPIIQQNKWDSQVVVVLGKPTILFSSDEVTSKRTLELELTATEIK